MSRVTGDAASIRSRRTLGTGSLMSRRGRGKENDAGSFFTPSVLEEADSSLYYLREE